MLHIYAENFRSFPKIDWLMPDGLTLVDGENKDTGGSNMAGKTTLLDAWFWARYGWLPKWKGPKGGQVDSVLRRKNGQIVGKTLVKVTEKFGSDTIEIERQRPSRLRVWKNGVEQEGMDQKGLENLFGMGPERFLVCVYLPQRRHRSFFWMGDNERTELMSIVAGLEDLDRALEKAKGQKGIAEESLLKLGTKIEILTNQLQGLPDRLKAAEISYSEAESKLAAQRDLAMKADLVRDSYEIDSENKAKEEIDSAIDPFVEKLADIQFTTQSIQGEYDLQKKKLSEFPGIDQSFEQQVRDCVKIWSDGSALSQKIKDLDSKIEVAKQRIKSVEVGSCSECGQLLPADQREREKQEALKCLFRIRGEAAQLNEPNLVSLEKGYHEALAATEKHKAQIELAPGQLKSVLAELHAKIEAKRAEERETQKEIQGVKNEINRKWAEKKDELRREVVRAYADLVHLEKSFQVAKSMRDQIVEQESSLRQALVLAEKDSAQQKDSLNEALDLVEIFGPKGYRAVCFDGMIEKISDRAGQLLGVMTNNLYSTRLDQVGQDSKGNQKLVLKPVIIKNSSEVPLDDLSGGAEERVALAYDVAVSETAGEGLPLLLDEVLSGLDSVGKTEAMALLEEVSKTRPVLVTDHSSEFRASFSQVIKVVYESEESRLELA